MFAVGRGERVNVARMERSEVRGRPFPDFAVLHPGYAGLLTDPEVP